MNAPQTMEVYYRWQCTKWGHLDMLPHAVFPTVVINEEVQDSIDIMILLEKHGLTFEEFTELVPDGYQGTTEILITTR